MAPVTAVIPNWNGGAHLANVLADLRAQTTPPAEILIVDNGSTDGSEAQATIRLATNRGFAYAVNRGIEAAQHDWVAILNNDVRLPADWLERLLACAVRANAWFAAGKLLRAADASQIDGTYDLLCRGACAWRAGNGRADSAVWSSGREVFAVPLTAAVFRRDLFARAGLLDEEFESYMEDVEFGLRCGLAGYRGIYVPEVTARHIGSATLGAWNRETVRRISRNQLLLVARHYPPDWVRRYGWHVVVAQLFWGLVAVRHGAGWAWLRGKREGLRALRSSPRKANPALEELLERSEAEIRRLQQEAGYDPFWRLYFAACPRVKTRG